MTTELLIVISAVVNLALIWLVIASYSRNRAAESNAEHVETRRLLHDYAAANQSQHEDAAATIAHQSDHFQSSVLASLANLDKDGKSAWKATQTHDQEKEAQLASVKASIDQLAAEVKAAAPRKRNAKGQFEKKNAGKGNGGSK